MGTKAYLLAGASAIVCVLCSPAWAQRADASQRIPPGQGTPSALFTPPAEPRDGQEIVVTANKRQENIQTVGMSITAATGDQLTKVGVADVSQLSKIAPGFNATISPLGTPVLSVRGVNYYDQALAANPAVSLYTDEAPLPFSIMSTGATTDIQRVEVLKGPQGTLYGQNATGGAVNFIPNAPTDRLSAGIDASYARFNLFDGQAYLSGPVTDTLSARLAVHSTHGGSWQENYTRDARSGRQNLINGRLTLLWKPTDRLQVKLTGSGFIDRSQSQQAQLQQVDPYIPAQADPRLLSYPLAPHNARAADWSPCVNTSPFDEPYDAVAPGATLPRNATNCVGYHKNNKFYMVSFRLDYKLSDDIKLTSLTSHERFSRYQPLDISGTSLQEQQTLQTGYLETTYQEFRLSGRLFGSGSWITGVNYEHDASDEQYLQSTGNASVLPLFGVVRTNTTLPRVTQSANTYAVYASGDTHLTDTLKLNAGVRFTQSNKAGDACLADSGNGGLSTAFSLLRSLLTASAPAPIAPGSCVTLGPPPTFTPGNVHSTLREHNISWRVGLDWQLARDVLLYGNVSKGYKAGGFPALGLTSYTEFRAAKQENLLAYEVGFKSELLDRKVVFDGAIYYYQYHDKQTQGDIVDPAFGPAETLVNVPRSHILGFELSGSVRPFEGLALTPAMNYTFSRVDSCKASQDKEDPNAVGFAGCYGGSYHNYDRFGVIRSYTGSALPYTPKWQANIDGEYGWGKPANGRFYIGGAFTYQSNSEANFKPQGDAAQPYDALYTLNDRSLVDLRAGYERANWRVQVFGRNVTNKYYVTTAQRFIDGVVYYAGMPATYGVSLSYRFN